MKPLFSHTFKIQDLTLVSSHSTQLRRYEKGETADSGRFAEACHRPERPNDILLFNKDEQWPTADFLMQFEALTQLSTDDKKAVRAMIDGMLISH